MNTLVGVALLMAVAALGLWLLERLIRSWLPGFLLLGVVVVVASLDVRVEGGLLGFAISDADVVAGLLLAAAAARLLRADRIHGPQALLLVYGTVVLVSVAGGVAEHGIGASVNEARKFVRFTSVALYFSSFPFDPEARAQFMQWWLWTAGALIAVAVGGWLSFLSGVKVPLIMQPDDLRSIDSFATLVVLQALLFAVAAIAAAQTPLGGRVPAPRVDGLTTFSGVALLAILVLQHRTLWGALLLGAALLAQRHSRGGRLALMKAAGVTTILVGVSVILLGQGIQDVAAEQLSKSVSNDDTLEWRVQGWMELIDEQGPDDFDGWVLGNEFGGGFPRYLGGQLVNVSPHNFPLEVMLRLGLVGLVAFVGFHAVVVVRLWRSNDRYPMLGDNVLAVGLVVAFVYYLTSHPQMEQGALLGVAIAVAAGRRRDRNIAWRDAHRLDRVEIGA